MKEFLTLLETVQSSIDGLGKVLVHVLAPTDDERKAKYEALLPHCEKMAREISLLPIGHDEKLIVITILLHARISQIIDNFKKQPKEEVQ